MGSQDLFHKRKARNVQNLARSKAKRAPYDRVLIVCEGEKSEPYYLAELRDYYGLNTANILIDGSCGSDPMSVFRRARQCYDEVLNTGDAYDRVYCVIDKDKHSDYQQAVSEIGQAKPKNCFYAITSVPCFEYWLLLHFFYTTQPFQATGTRSICDNVGLELRNYMPDYKKGDRGLFIKLLGQLDFAKANAARSLATAEAQNTDHPSTRLHELVDYLQNLKK